MVTRLLLLLCSLLLFQLIHGYNLSQTSIDIPNPLQPTLDIFTLKGDDKDCPPCFNCLLPGFECLHFANCSEYDGKCNCPPGFGGDDCKQPCKITLFGQISCIVFICFLKKYVVLCLMDVIEHREKMITAIVLTVGKESIVTVTYNQLQSA